MSRKAPMGETQFKSERLPEKPKEKRTLQPPLTPMIDCTFLLLTYFIMTSTFTRDEGELPGTLPKTGPAQFVPASPVKVILQSRGLSHEDVQYAVDNHSPVSDPQKLFELLCRQRNRGYSEDVPVVIRPQGQVRWKYVTEVFNQALRAKYKNVVFARASS